MRTTVAKYLRDLLRELDDVATFSKEGREAFLHDRRTQKAIIRSYEVIGEIVKRLPARLRAENPQIDWRRLITFRDFLAHNYERISLRYIWEAVEDLPALRAAIEAMLQSVEEGSGDGE